MKRSSGSSKNAVGAKTAPEPAETVDADLPQWSATLKNAQGETSGFKVGDQLSLRIEELAQQDGVLSIEPESGSPSLDEQGWMLFPSEKEKGVWAAVPVQSGERKLSHLQIFSQLADGTKKKIGLLKEQSFKIQSLLKEGASPPPEVLPPVSLPFPWAAVLGAVGGLLLLTAVLVWVWKKYFKKKPVSSSVVPPAARLPEDEVALGLLAELEKSAVWKNGEFKKHYFSVSELLKEYLGERYGFDALECTSHELEVALEKCGLSTQKLREIHQLYENLDRVKFTDFQPPLPEPLEILEKARELVLTTRRIKTQILPENSPKSEKEGPVAF